MLCDFWGKHKLKNMFNFHGIRMKSFIVNKFKLAIAEYNLIINYLDSAWVNLDSRSNQISIIH